MTRKDYILIAGLLGEAYRNAQGAVQAGAVSKGFANGMMAASETVARGFAADNPRFNREHFLAVVRGEKDLNSRPARRKSKANSGLVALANHPGWRQ